MAERGSQEESRGNERGGDFSSRVSPKSLLPVTAIGVDQGSPDAVEQNFALDAGRGFTAAIAWFSSLCVLLRSAAVGFPAYPTRTLAAGPTPSGQTLRSPQRRHCILAMSGDCDATDRTRVAAETLAARTLLQPLRAGPSIRADRFGGLIPDAG